MMRICFRDGRSEEAILLAARDNAVRVAIRDCDDSAEFRLHNGQWLSEANLPVHIEVWPESGFRHPGNSGICAPEPVWIQ